MQRKREKRSKNKNKLLSSYDSDDMDNATKEKKELKELLRLDNYYKINNDQQEEESIFIQRANKVQDNKKKNISF